MHEIPRRGSDGRSPAHCPGGYSDGIPRTLSVPPPGLQSGMRVGSRRSAGIPPPLDSPERRRLGSTGSCVGIVGLQPFRGVAGTPESPTSRSSTSSSRHSSMDEPRPFLDMVICGSNPVLSVTHHLTNHYEVGIIVACHQHFWS